jgi:hypothetical protein
MIENLKTGRPRAQNPKSFSVKVRLNEDEKTAFDELAKSLNVRPALFGTPLLPLFIQIISQPQGG